MYRIREVDPRDNEVFDDLTRLHDTHFPGQNEYIDLLKGHWWLCCFEDEPVGFCGIQTAEECARDAYLCRVAVAKRHRGNGLQHRMMMVAERAARRLGYQRLVSETTCNVHSANNFVSCDWRMYNPPAPWAFEKSIYWRKQL